MLALRKTPNTNTQLYLPHITWIAAITQHPPPANTQVHRECTTTHVGSHDNYNILDMHLSKSQDLTVYLFYIRFTSNGNSFQLNPT